MVRYFLINAHQHAASSRRFPVVDIEVPSYELPLPEGVGEEKLQREQLSMREIEETWRERLHNQSSSSLGPQPSGSPN